MKISFRNMIVELNIFDIRSQLFEYDLDKSMCLIEKIVEETFNEPSIKDLLGECFTHLEGDLNLDKLL